MFLLISIMHLPQRQFQFLSEKMIAKSVSEKIGWPIHKKTIYYTNTFIFPFFWARPRVEVGFRVDFLNFFLVFVDLWPRKYGDYDDIETLSREGQVINIICKIIVKTENAYWRMCSGK